MDNINENKERKSRSRSPVHRSRSRSDSPIRRRRPIRIISNRVYVKNIPYDVKWQELKDKFRDNVGGVTYAELVLDNMGRSTGVAVLEFEDMDHARKAVETMHRYKIKDRKLIVLEERETDRGSRSAGVVSASPDQNMYEQLMKQLKIEGPVNNTIFVSNLDYTVDNRKLREVFSLAGNILRCEIMRDSNGRSRGNALVQFETPLEAIQAISMFNNQELYSRAMRVKMDKENLNDQSSIGPALPSGLKGIGQSLQDLGIAPNVPTGSSILGLAGPSPGAGIDLSTLAGLTGLSNSATSVLGNTSISGLGALGAGGLGGLHGNLGGGLNEQVALNNLMSIAGVDSLGPSRMTDLGRGDSVMRNMDRRGQSSGLNNEESTLIVKNLPYSYPWKDLKQKFLDRDFDVRYVELKPGKSGTGTIRLSSPDEAKRACDVMNRMKIEGREMVLKLARGNR